MECQDVKSKYAILKERYKIIELYDSCPKHVGFNTLLKNVSLYFKDGFLRIKAEEVVFGFSWDGFWHKGEDVDDDHIITRFDLFSWRKKPYVKKGWYKKKNTKPFNAILKTYSIYEY